MVVAERAFGIKMCMEGVASRRIVSASASVVFPRRQQAVMEEVDKGCSEFCITAGTVTRTAGIPTHSWLVVLAVNLSWLSG